MKAWAGLFGGAFCWYGAHELGFYFSNYNCRHPWIVPAVHLAAILAAIMAGAISYRSWKSKPSFAASLGGGAACLFTLVIFWQGVAALVYRGCER